MYRLRAVALISGFFLFAAVLSTSVIRAESVRALCTSPSGNVSISCGGAAIVYPANSSGQTVRWRVINGSSGTVNVSCSGTGGVTGCTTSPSSVSAGTNEWVTGTFSTGAAGSATISATAAGPGVDDVVVGTYPLTIQ